ncbi:MAG: hypothetical protein KC649_04505, partial [Candidatus Omnitrophica bacterium]|nr:hypothetical protein [Candidatus Omnitrophota bacterium]
KSNISDSIKWVLGEQSAKSLRGSKMEDVIFNGADAQEPVNFAQVSITLDNSDRSLPVEYDEVVISRKLYRSGESVYLLNGSPIRLKDVHSILAGTGMGVGNYSFIEQGKIDSILSAKPEDRRTLFEEAAGITKFKIKKKETLRNLEACEANLQRANDIITELSKQIASLERQAKKAEKYKKDFETLKIYDLTAAIKTTLDLLDSQGVLHESVEELGVRRTENSKQLEVLAENYAEAREILQEVEAVYSEFKSQQAVIDGSIQAAAEKVEIFTRYIEELKSKITEIKTQIESTRSRITLMINQSAELEKSWQEVSEERQSAQENIDKAQLLQDEKTHQLTAMQEEIKAAESEFESANAKIQQFNLRQAEIQSSRSGLLDRVTELNTAAEALSFESENLKAEVSKNEELEAALNQKIRTKILEREKIEQAVVEAQQKLKSLDQQSSRLVSEISAEQSKLGVLEELAEQHEGYSKGAKYLLELKRKGEISGDVVGALADLVEVEPGYEMALEAALDSLAQAIVCDNFDSAVRISKTLNQQGRAILFYPSSNTVSDEKVPAPANLKRLIDFTRSGSSISKTYQELIRKYYIVDSLADAFELSAQFKDFVFVTKSGEICRNNIVIAGKLEAGEAGHLFGRESRIQMLKARIAELKIELGELKNTESDAVSRIESLQSSLKAAAEEIPALQVAHADAANQKAASERRLSEISESKSEKIRVSNALKEKADNLDAELSSIGSGLTDYTENLRVLQSKTQELKASKENCLIEREEILVKITTLKSNQQTVVQRAAQIEREMQSLKASLSEAERFVEAKETELTASEKRVVDTSAQIEELSDRLNQLQADKDSMSSRFDEIMTDKNA